MIRTAEEDQREAVREHQESLLRADDVILQEAILGVIDDGDQDEQPWLLYERIPIPFDGTDGGWSQGEANSERLNFANAVVARVRQLKQIDEEMTK